MPTTLRRPLAILAAGAVLVAGCATGGSPPTGSPGVPATSPSPAVSPSESPASGSRAAATDPPASAAGTPPAVVPDRPWATANLIDVATGEPFRIADLVAEGKVVFVETMAIWCTNCRAQQADAMVALGRLDRSRVAWVALDVDRSETAEALAAYGPRWGFEFTYAIAGPDVSRALADDFGDLVLSPPSTPIVVVGTDGTVTLTDYGPKSVDQIVELAAAHGA